MRAARLALLAGIPLAGIVASAAPLQRATRSSTRVVGLVYDSVSHLTLSGALVQLVSRDARLAVVTDSAGRFAFPQVERGRFVVGFFHPKLDSLGVDAPLAPLNVGGEAELAVELAVPSVGTVLRQACGDDATRDSSGVVVGFARNASTAGPLADATVRARWSEITIGVRGGAQVRVRDAVVRAGTDGWFALCRVPAGGLVLVTASTTSDSGATLEMSIPPDGLLTRDVFIADGGTASASLRGTVRNPYGEPLAGARVRLWGSSRETRSNERGEFVLTGLPPGTRMLELRSLGFSPRRELVDLLARQELLVDLPLDEFPTSIDTVRVFSAQSAPGDRLQGFARRRALSQGVFFDPEAIERRHPLALTDLMRGIAGVDVVTIDGARAVVMRSINGSGSCEPEWIVDGMRMPRYQVSVDDLIPASIVQAIEVYPRRIQAPAEYQSLTCGSIVIWTGARGWLAKRGRMVPRKG